MSCMCGDSNCLNCGTAMGANPELEMICEWLDDLLTEIYPIPIDTSDLAEAITNQIESTQPQWFINQVEKRAAEYAQTQKRRRQQVRQQIEDQRAAEHSRFEKTIKKVKDGS